METPTTTDPAAPPALDVLAFAKAVRFALVAIVLTLACLNLRWGWNVRAFEQVFNDMLAGAALPGLTLLVFRWRVLFEGLAIGIPVLMFGTLFMKRMVGSIYVIGFLGVLAVVEAVIFHFALFSPIVEIIKKMQGGGGT